MGFGKSARIAFEIDTTRGRNYGFRRTQRARRIVRVALKTSDFRDAVNELFVASISLAMPSYVVGLTQWRCNNYHTHVTVRDCEMGTVAFDVLNFWINLTRLIHFWSRGSNYCFWNAVKFCKGSTRSMSVTCIEEDKNILSWFMIFILDFTIYVIFILYIVSMPSVRDIVSFVYKINRVRSLNI